MRTYLLALTILFSSTVVARSGYEEATSTKYFKKPTPDITLDQLIKQWSRIPDVTVEKAISQIPASIRLNYGLLHTSGSLQAANYENPRAILFSTTANLVLSFNGHSGQVGGDRIEAMTYNRTTEIYDFAQIHFDRGGLKVEMNPRKCLSCHTPYRIANWGNYPDWRGAYGSISHEFQKLPAYRFHDRVQISATSYTPEGYYLEDISGENEFSLFQKFLGLQSKNSRYRYLVAPRGERYWPLSPSLPLDQGDNFDYQPLRRIGIGLVFHQGRSLGSRLAKSKMFNDYPASLTALLLRCDASMTERFRERLLGKLAVRPLFMPADEIRQNSRYSTSGWQQIRLRSQLLALTGVFPEAWNSVLSARSNSYNYSPEDASFTGAFEMTTPDIGAGVILLEKIRAGDQSMKVRPDGPSPKFSEQMLAPLEFVREMHQIIPLYAREKIGQACVELQPKILAEDQRDREVTHELSEVQWQEVRSAQRGVPYVIRQCAECHSQGSYAGAPFIPFENESQFKLALLADSRRLLNEIRRRTKPDAPTEIRMPLGPSAMPPGTHETLMKYLDQLSGNAPE